MKRLFAVCLLLLLLGLPRAAAADEAPGVTWDPSWRRFSWWDAAGTLAVGGGALAVALSGYRDEGYREGVLADEAVRDALVARTRSGRNVARVIGDRIFQVSLVYPYLVDALLVTWIGNGAPDVAGQMALMSLQAQGVAALVGLSTAHFVGRARPSVAECERDPFYERHCGAVDENASFMSGHTATASLTAGLVCAHNSKLRLYGDTSFGLVECLTAITAATGVGVTRLIADRHWHSDVVSGASLGVASGYLMPMLLHYGWTEAPDVMVVPQPLPGSTGVSLVGSF
jgi:membrane-associated phospholipid phosphatase